MTEAELHQQLWKRYEKEHNHAPASARQVAEWAIGSGLLELPKVDPFDIIAGKIARSLREEYATDNEGRRYRVNHAVRVMKNGVQLTLWGMLDFSDSKYMAMAFTQRREQIVGDCHQLKTDVDVFNNRNSEGDPIQMDFDFTDDLEERDMYRKLDME